MKKVSSSNSAVEVATSKRLQSDAIPALEKLQKKKERAMKQKQRQDKLLKDSQKSYDSGSTRSCRTRRTISYTFEAYDRTMKEAIQLTNKRRKSPVVDQDRNGGSEDQSNVEDVSTDNDSKMDVFGISDSDDTGYENENENHGGSEEEEEDIDSKMSDSEAPVSHAVSYPKGVRSSNRLAGVPGHAVPESRGLVAKQRVRQRPTQNTAIESTVVLDSEDEAREGKTDSS